MDGSTDRAAFAGCRCEGITMPERSFSTYQIANLLGATPGAVVQWIQKGLLPVQRSPDGVVRISEKGLISFLASRGADVEEIMAKVAARGDGESAGDGLPITSAPAPATAPARQAVAAEVSKRGVSRLEPPIARDEKDAPHKIYPLIPGDIDVPPRQEVDRPALIDPIESAEPKSAPPRRAIEDSKRDASPSGSSTHLGPASDEEISQTVSNWMNKDVDEDEDAAEDSGEYVREEKMSTTEPDEDEKNDLDKARIAVPQPPDSESHEVRQLKSDFQTQAIAMRVVMEYEQSQDRQVFDVHEKNLGYDITSLDLNSGELRLIDVKGIGATQGTIILTPNEHRVAQDRRDCYWLYVVTDCSAAPILQEPISDPARFQWHEVRKVDHYWIDSQAICHRD